MRCVLLCLTYLFCYEYNKQVNKNLTVNIRYRIMAKTTPHNPHQKAQYALQWKSETTVEVPTKHTHTNPGASVILLTQTFCPAYRTLASPF
jgi:hypothetical protein